MLSILDNNLPSELSDIIYKKIKDDFNKNLKYILEYETVWIITEGKLSFLILERNLSKNPYYLLEYENYNKFEIVNKKKKKKIEKKVFKD